MKYIRSIMVTLIAVLMAGCATVSISDELSTEEPSREGSPIDLFDHRLTPEGVRAALDAGADLEAREDGFTPLMFAASNNTNPEVVQLLLDAGADLEARDENGQTPLILAARDNKNPEVLQALLNASSAGAYLVVNAFSDEAALKDVNIDRLFDGDPWSEVEIGADELPAVLYIVPSESQGEVENVVLYTDWWARRPSSVVIGTVDLQSPDADQNGFAAIEQIVMPDPGGNDCGYLETFSPGDTLIECDNEPTPVGILHFNNHGSSLGISGSTIWALVFEGSHSDTSFFIYEMRIHLARATE